MIYYSTPWDSAQNIGQCYNNFMKLLPEEIDYACFTDADTCFTTSNYGKIIENQINNNPNTGLWTCLTNRIGCPYQKLHGIKDSNDIKYHRMVGSKIYNANKSMSYKINNLQPLSGFFFIIQKKYWQKVGGFRTDRFEGVDNYIHMDLNYVCDIRMMLDLYVFHWYRGSSKLIDTGQKYKKPKLFSL